jgi:glycosyltransferase involved in cell wall biosynthesis
MRIGIITGEFPPRQGGVGAYTRILAEHLAAQNQQVVILSERASRSDSTAFELTSRIDDWGFRCFTVIRTWAHQHALDIICLQYQTAAYAMSPWIHAIPQMIRPIPLVTTFHDLRPPYLFPKAGPLRTWIVDHLARSSRGVIATNQEDYERLAALSHTALIPVGSNIAPLSFDAQQRASARRQVGAREDDFLIAYFGLINHSKGLDLLIDALADLCDQGFPVRLVIIGGTPGDNDPTNLDYAKAIQSQIAHSGMAAVVTNTGYLDEQSVGALLAAADVNALPYRDGASFRRGSLMAAIQHGAAIITTTPVVDIPAFRDGENMLLIPPDNAPALAAALHRLADDQTLRDQLRRGAAQLAPTFDWSTIAAAYIAFFQRILTAST